MANLFEKVGKKFAELDGFNQNSWATQQNKWQEVEQRIAQFRVILENMGSQFLVMQGQVQATIAMPKALPPTNVEQRGLIPQNCRPCL